MAAAPALVVGALLLAIGLFALGFGRDRSGRLLGIPIAMAGAGVAWVGVGRLAAVSAGVGTAQTAGALLALVALAVIILGGGLVDRGAKR